MGNDKVIINGPNKTTINLTEDNRLYIQQYQRNITNNMVDLGVVTKEGIDEIISNLKRIKTHL